MHSEIVYPDNKNWAVLVGFNLVQFYISYSQSCLLSFPELKEDVRWGSKFKEINRHKIQREIQDKSLQNESDATIC